MFPEIVKEANQTYVNYLIIIIIMIMTIVIMMMMFTLIVIMIIASIVLRLIWKNRRMRVVDSNKSRILSPCAMRTNSIEIFGCCDYTMASDTFRKYLAKALLSVQNTKTPLKGIFLGYIAS